MQPWVSITTKLIDRQPTHAQLFQFRSRLVFDWVNERSRRIGATTFRHEAFVNEAQVRITPNNTLPAFANLFCGPCRYDS